jgi:prolyl 4-hydroxylase
MVRLFGLLFLSSLYGTSPEFERVCHSPKIYVCEHFLSDEECDYLIGRARPLLERATVVDLQSDRELIDSARTSLGVFLPSSGKKIDAIHQRIARVTGIPEENGENMQVLYYDVGAQYLPHYDSFDPRTPGGFIHYNRGGQRVATFMVYLNTPEAGGQTVFPRAGVSITPEKGKAVLFYNVDDQGEIDPESLHGGAPVLKGEKWLVTRWLRENAFR